jgi:hypothetical protein
VKPPSGLSSVSSVLGAGSWHPIQDDDDERLTAQITSALAELRLLEMFAVSGGDDDEQSDIQASQARLVQLVRAKHARSPRGHDPDRVGPFQGMSV